MFSVGSLTVGASFVFGFMHVASIGRIACAAALVLGMVYVCCAIRRMGAQRVPVMYQADAEADRYTDMDIRELARGLSEAKAKSAHPFYTQRSQTAQQNGM